MKTTVLSFAILFLMSISLFAQPVTQAGEPKDVVITFYNANYASVFENRTVRLQRGTNKIILDDIPLSEEMRGLTIFFDGTLVETRQKQTFSSIAGLLPEMIGEQITLHGDESLTGVIKRYRANLLELMLEDGSIQLIPNVSQYRITVHNPAVLERFYAPVELTVNANKTGRQQIHVFYVTHSMGWSAEHRVVMNEETNKLTWQTYAALSNNTSNQFDDVTLRFFSGQINLSQGSPRYDGIVPAYGLERSAMDIVQQESTGDYYIYTYGRKSLVKPKEQTRISLHELSDIAFEKRYVHAFSMYGSNRNNLKPSVQIEIDTDGPNGLNTTLPAGSARFLVNEESDTPIIRGEQYVPLITPGDKLKLTLGSASDITISETRESTQNKQEGYTEYRIVTTIRNNMDEAVTVDLPLTLNAQMQLISSQIRPERTGDMYLFNVDVQQDGSRSFEVVVRHNHRSGS